MPNKRNSNETHQGRAPQNLLAGFQKILTFQIEDILTWQSKITDLGK